MVFAVAVWVPRVACVALVAAQCSGGDPRTGVDPRQVQLVRIVRHLQDTLSTVADCTCLETIQRGVTRPGKSRPRRLDTVRMEVAFVGGKEMFGPPGARRFESDTASSVVSVGLAGSGHFGEIAQTVLTAATMDLPRKETLDGRPVLRIDYRVPYLSSGLVVCDKSGKQARVPSRGSLWVSRETFDLVQLSQIADEIPTHLDIGEVRSVVRYANVQLGSAVRSLPQIADLSLKDRAGEVAGNRIEFSQCRRFAVASSISPDTHSPAAVAIRNDASEEFDLPPNLRIELQLQRALDSHTAAVGDAIEAVVRRDLFHNGALLIPRKAFVSGRIRRIERHDEPREYIVVGLEFTEIEYAGKRARFAAALEDFQSLPGLSWFLLDSKVTRRVLPSYLVETVRNERIDTVELPGVGTFFAEGTRVHLPAGFAMTWRTTQTK